jgi:hypothetical protein
MASRISPAATSSKTSSEWARVMFDHFPDVDARPRPGNLRREALRRQDVKAAADHSQGGTTPCVRLRVDSRYPVPTTACAARRGRRRHGRREGVGQLFALAIEAFLIQWAPAANRKPLSARADFTSGTVACCAAHLNSTKKALAQSTSDRRPAQVAAASSSVTPGGLHLT